MSGILFNPYELWFGLEAGARPANHYQLLGLAEFTSDPLLIERAAEIRRAYVEPFAQGEQAAVAHRILGEIALARQCLLSEESKAAYDRRLRGERPARERWSYLTRAKAKRASVSPPVLPPPLPVARGAAAMPSANVLSSISLLLAGSVMAMATLNLLVLAIHSV